MTDPSSTDVQDEKLMLRKLWLSPDDDKADYDDDDDEADYDDSDDDDNPAVSSCERWMSRADFGTPEWWSRT